MKVIDSYWTPQYNIWVVLCDCGTKISHRLDRWKIRCPKCGRSEHKDSIKIEYLKR